MSKNDELRKQIGELMASARKSRGMSRIEIARRIGKTDVAVYYWEIGKNPITIDDFQLYCSILDVDWVELLSKIK